MSARFDHFAAIDWSGAQGERQRGIAVALCGGGTEAPRLVRPERPWSRAEALDWILGEMPPDTLVGLDLGASLAFADRGAFFPEWADSPSDARGLWAFVEAHCAGDPHLSASSFVDHPEAARHFRRHGGRCGDLFEAGRGRLRVTEVAQREQGLNPYSNFNLVGAAQVGKSSLTGMRVLRRLNGRIPIWPFDPKPQSGSLVVEIYTSLAALAAGLPKNRTKVRDPQTLDAVLAALGSDKHAPLGRYDDHATDALISAAWLRRIHADPRLWKPPRLTPELGRTEGWTFGVY
ncbi:MAG: hypothetical protein ACJ8EB_05540 [Allosphingosinicella sp.]